MTRSRLPNTRLRTLLEEAGWTQEGLARAVNAVGSEIGLRLRYDRSAVAHWLSGSCPEQRVSALVCEALRRRTGRVVTAEQAGFPATAAGLEIGGSRLGALLHELSPNLPYQSAAVLPGQRGGGDPPVVPAQRTDPTGQPWGAVRFFTEVFLAHGGGFARTTLRAYLSDAIAGRLAGTGTPAGRTRYAEASQLTLLLGRMYADDMLHGAAQRCFLTARDLALAGGHQGLAVIALRTLSTQAHRLGHLRTADAAAEVAARTARHTPRAVRAFTQAQLAVTAASRGRRADALRALSAADSAADGAAQTRGHPFESYPRADLEFQRAGVLLALGEPAQAADALAHALATRPGADRRGAALTRLRLAGVLLSLGRLDEARDHERVLRGEGTGLRSVAVHRSMESLRQTLLRVAGRVGEG
ncbi:hypothetical protein [Streptomyces acidiscabies]|uniref:55.5 kDa and 49.5 kDa sporulation proteins n=3 Tax=Streptomyces acidiscabies TaxID=42234 RepID=A0AAP6BHV4_9ACTN|nr:hypothetical protein [Streptomyces acidiscabies]MBP5934988.1 hypothetical protein [Streptomyces sp. LBUM 1476]MBZ3917237.1 hypothetical protein [Streptomyces acidiscabies]MDX2964762.1 hypothetical protein [Streptomyces acidiscabies]MDX3023263.1 hypothetical protein [Streptomyces acidiscabies]MDX3795934.1 hypothetical protein [Streptomyces acidiscabies]